MIKNAREITLDGLLRVETDKGYSNLVLDAALTQFRLDKKDASFVSLLFYGVIERKMTLDYVIAQFSRQTKSKMDIEVQTIMRMGAYQMLYMNKIPHSAAVNESVKLVRQKGKNFAAGYINAVLRAISAHHNEIEWPNREKNLLEALSIQYSCPVWLIKLWKKAYGIAETEKILQSFLQKQPLTIRVNTLKISPDVLIKTLEEDGIQASKVDGLPGALRIKGITAIESTDAFNQGLFHVQDAASQRCALCTQAKPGQRIADVCAAPGGKSFTIAELMENKGEIFAYDLYESRVSLIDQGVKRLGISIIKSGVRDAASGECYIKQFDTVLCDVPCSGLGVIGKKPEIKYKEPITLANLPKLQYNILCLSSMMVRTGGRLVYSTCTINPKENNKVAGQFLAEHDDFVPAPVSLGAEFPRYENEEGHMATFLPHQTGSDGFFIAAFTRKP